MEVFIGQDVDYIADTCKLVHQRTRDARGCSWMFVKVYFLNFRYFLIAKKQQIVSSWGQGILLVPSSPPQGSANARGLARAEMGTAGIILLVSAGDRDLWPLPISEHAQNTRSVFFSQSDFSYLTMSP